MALLIPEDIPPVEEYDPEAEDRDESFVEKLAQDFTEDVEPILHDVYPDSDDEAGAQRGGEERGTPISRGDGTMYVGQKFFNGIAFKECVTDYALLTCYNLKQYRYDRDRLGFRCVGAKGKCEWRVYCASL
ncbi:uncharacterized protein LOC111828706 [Capsella rubella]|uniref:uncharacterized protein LOC111828706 n=1 Tax=Capsella rubella TaxID=81985 RepID=UPI000CD553C0|nr:uncharacterized protein LOC111828706 [Capsella rubella]